MENQRFLPYDNAPAHRSISVRDFVAENNVTTLENPPYSSDQTAADFYLFSLKGRRFCDATDMSKNATEELKGLS
jgi:transposase